MYFRNTFTKSGKSIQLVESFRDPEGRPRQRILISIGDALFPQALWKAVADEIQNRLRGVTAFFSNSTETEHWVVRILREIERKRLTTIEDVTKLKKPSVASIEKSSSEQAESPTLIQVDPKRISHHHTTELGPELVILHGWKVLGIDSLLKSLGFGDRNVELALLSVANRLIDPRSEHSLPAWVDTTSFSDLCRHIPKNLIDDQFYRVADLLFKHKKTIEATLAENERSLFSLKRTLYLYDTSNTYFEGKVENNPKAKRSKNSKEKRTDAKLIAFGLVLDEDGFVIKHENFPGNMHDSPTLIKMITALEKDIYTDKKPMIVMDSGFSGEENLKMLRDKGYDYIVTGRRPTRVAYEEDFYNGKFKKISGRDSKEPVSVTYIDEENERIVLCHSDARGEKEKAMLSNAEKSFLKDLQKLSKRLNKKEGRGCIRKESVANQALGKIKERHSRVVRYYSLVIEASSLEEGAVDISLKPLKEETPSIKNDVIQQENVKPLEKKTKKQKKAPSIKKKKTSDELAEPTLTAENQKQEDLLSSKKAKKTKKALALAEKEVRLTLRCKRIDEAYLRAEKLCGSYYMRCTRKDLTDEEIWKLYMTLTRVESGFRTLKTDLGLRPIFHHREDRCDSHIFITVLAYRILHWVEYMLCQKEDRRSWATIRRILQTHCYTTVVCPAEDGTIHHIRIPGTPEGEHLNIYQTLGVSYQNLPRSHMTKEKIKKTQSFVVSQR